MTERLDPDQLTAWARKAAPGERIRYHRGHLFFERTRAGGWGHDDATRAAVNAVRDCAWELYQAGAVRLVQRRHKDHDYSYLAVKRRGFD